MCMRNSNDEYESKLFANVNLHRQRSRCCYSPWFVVSLAGWLRCSYLSSSCVCAWQSPLGRLTEVFVTWLLQISLDHNIRFYLQEYDIYSSSNDETELNFSVRRFCCFTGSFHFPAFRSVLDEKLLFCEIKLIDTDDEDFGGLRAKRERYGLWFG